MKLRKAQIFLGREKELAVHVFFMEDDKNPSIINARVLDIIFPGLPQTPYFGEIESLVDDNRAIAYVHYYGSWYSGGTFTPKSVSQAVEDSIIAFKNGLVLDVYTEQNLKINVVDINLVGNSFGAHFVYNSVCDYKKILLAPLLAVSSNDLSKDSSVQVLSSIQKDIINYQKSLLYCYNGIKNNVWNLFLNSKESPRLSRANNVRIYIGSKDKVVDKNYVNDSLDGVCENISIKEIECGHNFFELYKSYVEDAR